MPDRDNELEHEYKSNSNLVFRAKEVTVTTIPPPTRSQQYDDVIKEAKEIFLDRNKMYKDAFTVFGLIGTVTTLVGDAFRLKYMIFENDDYGKQYKEQIRDKLLDIINQAVISIFVLDNDNFKGK
jgi:hypothetical protein